MFAAYGNHPHAVNELLNHSSDLTMTNLNDDTALSIAIKRSSKEGEILQFSCLTLKMNPTFSVTCSPECYRGVPLHAAPAFVAYQLQSGKIEAPAVVLLLLSCTYIVLS